jgi:hypothetical protein
VYYKTDIFPSENFETFHIVCHTCSRDLGVVKNNTEANDLVMIHEEGLGYS